MKRETSATSRRDFVKTAAVVAGSVGALSACGNATTSTAPPSDGPHDGETDGLPITVAGYPLDRVQALIDGRVEIEGCSLSFQKESFSNVWKMHQTQRHEFQCHRTLEFCVFS